MLRHLLKKPSYGLAIAALSWPLLISAPAAAGEIKSVVELFTSQGCSSCPPADKLLGDYAKRDDVLALAFHVDYWDYLGWRDSFGSADNSERQRAYAQGRGDRNVYTPQAIVNGYGHLVGSRAGQLQNALSHPRTGTLPVDVSLVKQDSTLQVQIASDQAPTSETTLWLVYFNDEETVEIKRGENRGRSITYHNIVRDIRPLGMWKGGAMQIDLPLAELAKSGYDNCAVLLQATRNGQPGAILGAAVLSDEAGLRM